MKKLIAILVVFAIMVPALFAQDAGEWSIGGRGEVSSRLDFVPWELRDPANVNSDQSVVLVGVTAYNDYQKAMGRLGLTYRRGSLSTTIELEQTSAVTAALNFDNGIFSFAAKSNLFDLMTGEGDAVISNLWGAFNLLDGVIELQAAIKSQRRDNLWTSSGILPGDTYTLVDGSNYLLLNVKPIDGFSVGLILPGIFDYGFPDWQGQSVSATRQDAWTPMPFSGGYAISDYMYRGWATFKDKDSYRRFIQDSLERMTFGIRYQTGPFNAAVQYGLRGRPGFYREVATNIVRDAGFLDSVLYFGAQYNLTSAIAIDIAAKGEFFKSFDNGTRTDGSPNVTIVSDRSNVDPQFEDVSRTALAMGARFQYSDGPLQARLGVQYFNDIWTANGLFGGGRIISAGGIIIDPPQSWEDPDAERTGYANTRAVEGGIIRLQPFFRYNIIPSHLQFRVETKLDIPLSDWYLARFDPYEKSVKDDAIENEQLKGRNPGAPAYENIRAYSLGYEFVPEIFFNVLGTGASDIGDGFTGIGARYRLSGTMFTGDLWNKRASNPTRNAFDIIFRWAF